MISDQGDDFLVPDSDPKGVPKNTKVFACYVLIYLTFLSYIYSVLHILSYIAVDGLLFPG